MRYITGTYALNLPCSLDTSGDWHYTSIDWEHVPFSDSEDSRYGEWGIEELKTSELGQVKVANHVRALLDLIERGLYSSAQGMREYFLSNEDLTPLMFEKVSELKESSRWQEINSFMGKEYGMDWLEYIEDGKL